MALMATLGDPELNKWAQAHKAIIDRFGRFPHRNACARAHVDAGGNRVPQGARQLVLRSNCCSRTKGMHLATTIEFKNRADLRLMALRVLTPFALGYFLTYLLRAVNAVVAPDLVAEVGLGAAELGLLTAAYLGAFALVQLPLGVLLDRYGPRRVQAASLGVATLGCLLFAAGRDALTLTTARALIGLGFAGGLMSGFKAVVIWVPGRRRALARRLRHVVWRARAFDGNGTHRARGTNR